MQTPDPVRIDSHYSATKSHTSLQKGSPKESVYTSKIIHMYHSLFGNRNATLLIANTMKRRSLCLKVISLHILR